MYDCTKNNKIPKNKFNQGGERLRTMKTISHWWGFPGGSVVKNPPVNAGDTGRTPHAVEQLGPWAATIEPVLWIQEPHLLRPRAAATQLRAPWSLCSATRSHHKERPTYRNKRSQCSDQDPAQAKINKSFFKRHWWMKLKKTNKWKDILYSWTGETLFKYPYSPQQSTDSIQSLSKLPMAYFKKLEQIILKCIWSPKKFPNGQNNPEKEEKSWRYHAPWFQTVF